MTAAPPESLQVPPTLAGQRLDIALVRLFPGYSRAFLQSLNRQKRILVDGGTKTAGSRLHGGENITVDWPAEQLEEAPAAQAIAVDFLYQDAHFAVIRKPAGLVVHPAAGHRDGTLLNGLLHADPTLAALPRAGIVHRLDKDTSGLLLIARNRSAHYYFVEALRQRRIARHYLALVEGVPIAGGSVDAPIGRHRVDRQRMAVRSDGRASTTHFSVLERYRRQSLLQLRLESGRTHQIRVHMAHIGHPLVGDALYGGRPRLPPHVGSWLQWQRQRFCRQALHAFELGLHHPNDGQWRQWRWSMPADMAVLCAALRYDRDHGQDG